METLEDAHGPRVRTDKLALGCALIVIGVLLTLEHAGGPSLGGMRRLWPVLLLALGVGRLLSPVRRDKGLLLSGLGVIFLLHTYDVAPLHQVWPLFLVLGGLSMLLRAHGGDGRGHPRTPGVHVRWHA